MHPNASKTRPREIKPESLNNYTVNIDTGCWLWKGPMLSKKPMMFWPQTGRKNYSARRLMWEKWRGPIPAGANLYTDFCTDHRCINPDHYEPLEPVDQTPEWRRTLSEMRAPSSLRGRRVLTPEELFDGPAYEPAPERTPPTAEELFGPGK